LTPQTRGCKLKSLFIKGISEHLVLNRLEHLFTAIRVDGASRMGIEGSSCKIFGILLLDEPPTLLEIRHSGHGRGIMEAGIIGKDFLERYFRKFFLEEIGLVQEQDEGDPFEEGSVC